MTPPRRITILYFGLLAERRGLSEELLETNAATPAELFSELAARHPLGISTTGLKVAVNDEFVPWDHSLNEGDITAFLPPMSGG